MKGCPLFQMLHRLAAEAARLGETSIEVEVGAVRVTIHACSAREQAARLRTLPPPPEDDDTILAS